MVRKSISINFDKTSHYTFKEEQRHNVKAQIEHLERLNLIQQLLNPHIPLVYFLLPTHDCMRMNFKHFLKTRITFPL